MADVSEFATRQEALEVAELCHKLLGGDRDEVAAVGRGRRAQQWLAANGPPRTTGYSLAAEEGNAVPIIEALETELTADPGRASPRLTGPERARVAAAIAARVERGRPIPGGAGGVGRKESAGSEGGRP